MSVDGVRIHVALAGPADAPPLLLVHGWPQNWWAWREVIPALAAEHRVIAVDLPGFGWSDASAGGYEKERLAGQLLSLLGELGIERVTWIGHDWGGWIGFLAALRAPERFERMLAVTIPHFWAPQTARQMVALLGYQVPISLPVLGPRIADPMVRRILQVGRGAEPLSAEDLDRFAGRIPPQVSVAMYRTFLTRELAPIRRGRYSTPDTRGADDADPRRRGSHHARDASRPGARPAATPGGGHRGRRPLDPRAAPGVDHPLGRERARHPRGRRALLAQLFSGAGTIRIQGRGSSHPSG